MFKRVMVCGLALCLVFALGGCSISFGGTSIGLGATRGSGNVVEQTTAIDADEAGFSLEIRDISLQGNFNFSPSIVIDETLGDEIVLTTDDNIAELIRVDQRGSSIVVSGGRFRPSELIIATGLPITELSVGGSWSISHSCTRVTEFSAQIRGSVRGGFAFGALDRLSLQLSGSGRLSMEGAAEHARLTLSGSGDLNAFGLQAETADITISGSGRADITVAEQVNATVSGSGRLGLQGTAEHARLLLSGSGNINAFELEAETADVTVSGSGRADITVTEQLNATVSGSGRIVYDGNPRVSQTVRGSGRVQAR